MTNRAQNHIGTFLLRRYSVQSCVGASETLRLGLIGSGGRGAGLAQAFADPFSEQYQCVAVDYRLRVFLGDRKCEASAEGNQRVILLLTLENSA